MSRALGAAFLNHQVEQLEKSVGNVHGPSSGNWRDRNSKHGPGSYNNSNYAPPKRMPNKSPNGTSGNTRKKEGEFQLLSREKASPRAVDQSSKRRSNEQLEKDADIVVVDASALVHALHYLKKWCKNGREEVVIVPLEGLSKFSIDGQYLIR